MDMASSSSSTASLNQTQPENAFDELAPYLHSAPKSTEPWDIFINHCGSDVKHTLATTIYHKLHSMGFHVFLDLEALEAGDSIPAELQHAIASATLHIAIFSPNYAHSPWCLAELSFMLKSRAKFIPIFYHVDPSDLRYIEQGKGKYAHAFSEHEEKRRYTPGKLDQWKRALRDSSFTSGYTASNNKDEATVLKNVVIRVLQIMKKDPLWVVDHPVRLDELVKCFELVANDEKVKIRGIVGMGGSGKTTLAKELYNRNFSSFERCSFVSDVRDAASRNVLCEKQKKLLADLGVQHLPFDNVDEGKAILANRLSSHRALIVLDDVDHIDQLNALLPNKDNLGSPSMVIVTTRELGVLKSWGLSCIYNMPALAKPDAKQLFCWHAFLQPSPPAEFETLVEEFLMACNGLPLSLKVLGAQLHGRKSQDYWKSQLNKILRILPSQIKERLQVSYYDLDEEEREMFLDVSCFLIGEEKSRAIAVWDGSGWSGLHGLETLANKCLVELVDEDGRSKIRMHDHLRDMGREIASRQSPYRLWCQQQIDNLKKDSTKGKPVRGIQPADAFVAFKEYMHQLMENSSRQSKRFRFSNELQILFVKGNDFTEEFASLTEGLVWLSWEGFHLESLPSWLTLKNLRVLKLDGADELEELWQDNADPPLQLRELTLWGCRKLQWLPRSIRCLQHLERLVVEFHGSSLPEEFCGLQSLEYLYLHSPVLSSLPSYFGNLTSLRNITLQFCKQLSMLPDSFNQLVHLQVLDFTHCTMLSSLPAGLGNLTSLRNIHLRYMDQLSMLPDSFTHLIHLEVLCLCQCKMFSSLPTGFGNLISLRNISLEYCGLSSLPADFGNLINLRNINLLSCKQLSMLPDSFTHLIHLEVLKLRGCEMLSSLPVGFGNLIKLQNLDLAYCRRLSMLPNSFSQLNHLEMLDISGCEMLPSLPVGFGNLIKLRNIELALCNQLSSLPASFKQLIHIETFVLQMNHHLVDIETLPVSLKSLTIYFCILLKNIRCIGGLIKLEELKIWECPQIEELPSLAELASLNRFEMWGCPKVEKIQGLEHAKSLKILTAFTSSRVPVIQSLENVERLERLDLKCETISALKPCIRSIKGKECPRYMCITGSVIHLVEPIVKALEFPDLSVTELEEVKSLDFPGAHFCYVEESKVVRIWYSENAVYRRSKAKVVWGRRERVVEAFYRLLELLE